MSSINPFSYGKPIDDPARFIGRSREIGQIYSRLLSAFESSSIVGERRTGKTSLLKILAHPQKQAAYGLDPQKYTFIYQDFLFLDENTTPTRFWQRVLKALRRTMAAHADIVDEIELALKAETIDNYALDDIFTVIDQNDQHIVLLLDEFEQVTRNQGFDNDFFGGLRALAIHHNLALITSSRQDLVQLTHSEQLRSSPFFNIFATINLRNFTERDATDLIQKYLNDTEISFLLSELNVIFAIAGYNPYSLQMTCHHLFSAYQQNMDAAARRRHLIESARREGTAIFKDFWTSSTPSQQILLTILTLRELERRAGLHAAESQPGGVSEQGRGEDTTAELEHFYGRAGQVMPDLENRGMVIKNPETGGYHLFSTELSEWVSDEIVGDTSDMRAWREWQKDESLVGNLSIKSQELLSKVTQDLNPAYRTTLGNWLLDPTTSTASLMLLHNFVSRYAHYKETRSERDAASTMAVDHAPVGDTPKGVFALVKERLDDRQQSKVFPLPAPPTPKSSLYPNMPKPPMPTAAPTPTPKPQSTLYPNMPKPPTLAPTPAALDAEYRQVKISGLKGQLIEQTKNLNKLNEEAASYGSRSSAPLKLQNDIETIETNIETLQEELAALEEEKT